MSEAWKGHCEQVKIIDVILSESPTIEKNKSLSETKCADLILKGSKCFNCLCQNITFVNFFDGDNRGG